MLSAEELHDRGLAASNSGRRALAVRLLDRAATRTGDRLLLARIELSRAYVSYEQGDLATGLTLCEQALTRTDDATVLALAHSQLGVLHVRAGNGDRALEHLHNALAGDRLRGVERGRVLLNRGVVWLQRGHLAAAAADFDAAARDFDAAGMPVDAAKALHNSGYTRLLAGDLVEALQQMDQARAVLAPLSATFRAVCDQDRAEVLVAAGLHREARATVGAVAAAYGRSRLSQLQGEAELVLARLQLLEEPAAARVVARRAARRFRRRGSDVWADRADALELAADVGCGSHSGSVVRRADTIAGRLRADGLRHDARTVELQAARAEILQGDVAAAERRLARIRLTDQAPITQRLLGREVRAELAAARGRRGAATRQVRLGLADLHAWQSSFGSFDLQTSLVGHGQRLGLQGIRLALADGRPQAVFEWSERARALSSRVSPIRRPASAEAADGLAELRQLRTEHSGSPDQLSPRERELQARIRRLAWNGPGSGVVTEPVSWGEMRAALDDDSVLLAHLSVDDRLHLLVVSGCHADVIALGPVAEAKRLLAGLRADLDMAASRLPESLHRSVQASLHARLAALDEQLLAPARGLLAGMPDARVVLTSTGALAGLPWSMLPSLSGRSISQPQTATRWVASRTPKPLRSAGFAAGPNVPRAAEEVTRSAAGWRRARSLIAPDSTSQAVSALAQSVDVLHVSAHGRHAADNPLFSGLQLSDGDWFGYDIDQLERIPSLVVLSACELGRSTVRWGEEAVGMTTAWLHAGARSVIAAPAAVNDDQACELLTEVHRLLAAGVSPSEALAAAAGSGGSPFQCYGSGS
ncbi:CHAT domain-containing protein [Flexivirga caeni]|uniref:CHAT domain-containing protein n=1 Tax=Flexivirga caeni TaxID=2294115 RepID=A0A3M9MIC8_9MICO|nr:CHAT domain-containing tetratricopeptide repeat protein [Flexivirga caeni]RNI25312.1 CHAT domain-containing protein [Flexivirga caeni]